MKVITYDSQVRGEETLVDRPTQLTDKQFDACLKFDTFISNFKNGKFDGSGKKAIHFETIEDFKSFGYMLETMIEDETFEGFKDVLCPIYEMCKTLYKLFCDSFYILLDIGSYTLSRNHVLLNEYDVVEFYSEHVEAYIKELDWSDSYSKKYYVQYNPVTNKHNIRYRKSIREEGIEYFTAQGAHNLYRRMKEA